MKIKRTVTRPEEVVDDIICNLCEGSLKTAFLDFEGLHGYLCGGYESLLGDMVEYEFDICETCLLKWFKTFKREPRVSKDL